MLAYVAGRMDAAPHRLSRRPLGGGRGAAGEGRRRAGEDECEHRALPAPCVYLDQSRTCRMRMATSRGCTCMYTSTAVSRDGASAARLERHVGYAPGSVRVWPSVRHGPL
jgi:hypothetical protein